jgi:hypothetical protein
VHVFDAVTGELEWQSGVLGNGGNLLVENIDSDEAEEIVISGGDRVYVLDGASPVILWDSGILDDVIDVALGNIDGDESLELAILTSHRVSVIDTETWAQQASFELKYLHDEQSILLALGRILVAGDLYLQAFSAAGDLIWTRSFAQIRHASINDLAIAQVLGQPRIIVAGSRSGNGTLLSVLSADGAEELVAETGGRGAVQNVSVFDMDGDGDQELILGCESMVEIDKITIATSAMLGLGSAAADSGTKVTLDLVLTTNIDPVAEIVVDLETSLSFVAAKPGQAALAAGKTVLAGPSTDGTRVTIAGAGGNAIGDGVVAEIELAISSSAERGVRSISLELVSALDSEGFAVRLATQDGAVAVSEAGTPSGCSGTPLWFVAAAAHVSGEGGSQWRTDLSIQSSLFQATQVPLWFFPRGTGSSAAVCVNAGTVGPGASIFFEDVVQSVFGIEGAGGIGVGNAADSVGNLVVNSRTYNQTTSGTFGQGIPGRMARGAMASNRTALLTQLHENDAYRTNLGFLEVSGDGAEVEVQLFTQAGALLSTRSYTLNGYESKQVNRVFGAGAGVTNGFAVVTITSGEAVLRYASVVDNQTGDPTYIEPW